MKRAMTYMMMGAMGVLGYQMYQNRNEKMTDKALRKLSEMNRDTMKWVRSKI